MNSSPRPPICSRPPGSGRSCSSMKSIASTRPQQDVLLPEVEEGIVILVGVTTENPFFTINSPLVSRSRVFQFQPLSVEDIKTLLRRAAADKERGLGQFDIRLHDDALEFLAEVSDGDARGRCRPWRSACCRARARRSSLPARWPWSRSSGRRCSMTAWATPITIPSARSSRAFAAATPTRRSTGSRGCSKAARTCDSLPGGW